MPATRLYCMLSGFLHQDQSVIAHGVGMGTEVSIPVLMFLIVHPKGKVLYETGLEPAGARVTSYYEFADTRTEVELDHGIVPQLAQLGYAPNDIDYVVLSCLYFDHAGGLKYFPQSTIIVQREETDEAWWPTKARKLVVDGAYSMQDLNPARNFQFLYPETDEYDIFGDGSVIVLRVPCHARGEQAVLARLRNSTVLMPGGASPQQGHLELRNIQGRLMVSPDEALRSMEKISRIAQSENAVVLLHHDPNTWRSYKLAPEYYD